ncbi:DUF6541 family protein [Leucobacter japonicus]|uniref:DUF6541 family protein n=1 Tax=Leucobacter japonicus TaxID=1461259 RepID=UPI0006A78D7A|nr:DUF6541 family protein [Leucobacter japonicus]
MTAWLAFGIPIATALAIIAVLGLPAAFALRLRGFALVIVAIPAAFAVMALASIATPFVGIRWTLLPPLILAVVLAAVLFVLRRWIGARPGVRGTRPRARRELWVALAAAAIGGLVVAISLVSSIKQPGAISQTFDANFHLNAVRYILDGGSASPLTMDLTSPGNPVFYPTLWHAFVALVVQITGVGIPVATNAVLFVASCVVWPIGAVALGRAIAGPSIAATLISGAAAAAFPNFPLFLAGYGVLYPNILALTLMPFALVAGLQLLNLGPSRRADPLSVGSRWLLFVGALGGAVLAHPNVVHAILVWAAFPVLFTAIRAIRGGTVPGRDGLRVVPRASREVRGVLALIGLGIFAAAVVAAWVGGRTTDNSWQGFFLPHDAVLQLLGGTPHITGHAWGVSLLILLGAIMAWRFRSMRWVIGSAAALALFYVIADGFPTSTWRTMFVGPWYNDPRRLAALVPFGALPLLVLGARAGWALLRPTLRRAARAFSRSPGRAIRVLSAIAVLMLVAIGQSGAFRFLQIVQESYDQNRGMLVSKDEVALLDRLDDEVPEGEVIANNPLNGSSLSYALADRQVLFPHSGGIYDPRDYALVQSLVKHPEQACQVSHELDVHYVLDFGTNFVLPDPAERGIPFKDMQHLDKSPVLTEVDRQGNAVLYRITGC